MMDRGVALFVGVTGLFGLLWGLALGQDLLPGLVGALLGGVTGYMMWTHGPQPVRHKR